MKFLLYIVLGIVVLALAYFLLAAALGVLFQVIVVVVAASVIIGLARAVWRNWQNNKRPDEAQTHKRAEQQAEKALKELERSRQ